MSDLTIAARQLAPRLTSPAFDAAFGELPEARAAYDHAPRSVAEVPQLAAASARLSEARSRIHTVLHGPHV